MKINCDSQSAIFLEKCATYHYRTNNIDVQYHFVRDMVERNNVLLDKVYSLENITDSLTKSVSVVKFSWCREEMGIVTLGQQTYVHVILYQQIRKQVVECWVVIYFAMK